MTAPFFDPGPDRDACGVGFIAARDLAPSYRMTRLAVECLVNLDHRGARAADGTGDGAGLLTQVPHRLINRELATHGIDLSPGRLGVVMCFLSPTEASASRLMVTEAIEAEGMHLLFWRSVPTNPAVLGDHARLVLPLIEQAIVTGDVEGADFERSLYLARKRIERAAVPGSLHTVGLESDRGLQGAVHRVQDLGLLLGLEGPRLRDFIRHLSSALFDQHLPLLGQRPALPHSGSQRGDQHHPVQPILDAGSGEGDDTRSVG